MPTGLQGSTPSTSCFPTRWWLLIPLAAATFILVADLGLIRQAERVRDIDRDDRPAAYAEGRHWLVVPEQNSRSYQWLAETERMTASGEWRIRSTDTENAPEGREVHTASPYHWWLGLLAWTNRHGYGDAAGPAVERAALWAGPLLHLLMLATMTCYSARRFGTQPAAFLSVGLAVLFPLAGDFVPAVPDDHGLAVALAGWTVLLVSGGLRGARGDFIFSGIAGGLGLWVSAAVLVPVLGAIGLGGLLLAAADRRAKPAATAAPPWDRWALAGAITSLLAYFAEYYPDHLDLRLEANHPLYGLAWLGFGQLLALAGSWSRRELKPGVRTLAAVLGAVIGLAALPVAMRWLASPAFIVANPLAGRLANLTGSPVAVNFATWLGRDGLSLALAATVLPFALLATPGLAAFRKNPALVVITGALAAGLVSACLQLQWWGWCQLLLLLAVVAAWPAGARRVWLAAAVALLPGLIQLAATARPRDKAQFSHLEVEGLIERDIAHWIADHAEAPRATVLLPPERTPAFCYLGGLRGLGTPNWENGAGVSATVRILAATTAEEAQAQLAQRGVTHLVLLSWDTELDAFVRWASAKPDDTFLAALHRWALPPWLQPLPYKLPEIASLAGQSAVILQVTENTDRALALSRMAEYALEVQDQPLAKAVADSLAAFPANLVALAARAQLAKAVGDDDAFNRAREPLLQALAGGLDRLVPWDRRVSLAVVLAQARRNDLATTQLRRCVADATPARLRTLSAGSLYRLLVLGRALDCPLPDNLRDGALALLPAEARARL